MIVAAGEYICLESDKASSLYVVKSGMLVGSSKSNDCGRLINFGPGSIIGEFSLLESEPREFTLRAAEESEILVIEQEALQTTLKAKPAWIKAILNFLSSRNKIAQENQKKNNLVQAFPSLLYIFASHIKETGVDTIPLDTLCEKAQALNNTPADEVKRLLDILQELKLLKVQEKIVRAESLQIIPLLYETLKYRAIHQKISPNILSMTEQMVLSAFVKIIRENNIPLQNGLCTVSTEILKAEAKKSMHGLTLTSRTIAPLIQKNLLKTSSTFDIHSPIDNIGFFYADFDKIMDLLELNLVFPQLDKKLVM